MQSETVEILKQAELFKSLNVEVLKLLASRAVEKKLERDEILFLAGEPARGLFLIASGSVRAVRTSPDGREQVIHVEKAVTTIAEVPVFDSGTYPSTVAAEEPTTVYFLSRDDVLKTAIAHPQLALAATRLLASRLRRCAELVETLSLREVGQRLASLLLAEARSRGVATADGTKLKLRLTHNQLAARIGTVREVVSRTLVRLNEDGLILHKGKDILIPDLKSLATYAADETK
ncbi:MAG TPA: Crp/Fnr family transcriptional regulator [Pyrinomonadaceae bacterium]